MTWRPWIDTVKGSQESRHRIENGNCSDTEALQMNIEQLRKMLELDNVSDRHYSMLRPSMHDCSILDKDGSLWVTYFTERGCQHDLKYFVTEDEACEDLIKRLQRNGYLSRNLRLD